MRGLNINIGLSTGRLKGFPAPPIASPFIWTDASLSSSITTATGVQKWADISGNGRDWIQNTGANQPAYNAVDAAYNNKGTVQSTAANMFLATALFAVAQPFSLFIVGNFALTGVNIMGFGGGTLLGNASGVNLNLGSNFFDGVNPLAPSAILIIANGASSYVGVNDWAAAGGTSGNAGAGTISSLGLFASEIGGGGGVGKCAEIIGISRIATVGDKSTMAAYVLTKYGKTIT